MFDRSESLVVLVRAGRIVNPTRPTHCATLHRWATIGVKGGIILETVIIGGTRYTSREAIERFLRRLNAADDRRRAEHEPEPTAAAEAAGRKLAAMGC